MPTAIACSPALARERVDTQACIRVAGMRLAALGDLHRRAGDRMIVTYRDERIAAAHDRRSGGLVASADAVLADNRFPDFVRPICAAARARGLTVVLDADKPTQVDATRC